MTVEAGARDVFLTEILGQPDAFRRAGRGIVDQLDRLVRLLDARTGRAAGSIVLSGMGSSLDACRAAATVLAGRGVLATVVNAAELLHFRLSALGSSTLLIALSQSGESVEIVRLADALGRRADRPFLLAITNGIANPLAERADLVLDTRVGPELGPATGTFAGSLVVLAAVVEALAPAADLEPALRRVADAAGHAAGVGAGLLVAPGRSAARLVTWLGDRAVVAILGRGTARAAAEIGALTLKEAAAFPAEAYDTAAFRHGPLELAGPALAAVVIATEEATASLDRAFAAELATDGAAVLLVGGGDGTAAMPGVESVDVGVLDPMLAPAVTVIPLQLLAWRLALDRGRRPGEFIRAAKVTMRE